MSEDNLLETGVEGGADFLSIDLDSIPDQTLVPDKTECELEVKSVVLKKEKFYIELRLQPRGLEGSFQTIFHRIFLPKPEDDQDKSNNKLRMLKECCLAFSIQGILKNPDQFQGRRAFALIGIEPASDGYPEKNLVARFTGLKR